MEVDRDWHLDKRVSIATILSIVLAVISGAYFISNLEKSVDIVALNVNYNAREIEKVQRDMDLQRQQIIQQLESLNSKLDRVIERDLERNNYPYVFPRTPTVK
jgi:hypothetical protein